MSTLPTRSAITSNTTTNADQKVNLGDLRDFLAELLGTDSADKAAARFTLGVIRAEVRQTVQSSSVDSAGLPNFLATAASLNLPVTANVVPIRLTAANGFDDSGQVDVFGKISANTTVAVTNSQTNYIYADINASTGACTLGATILPPVYQQGGTYSVTSGQFTFNIAEMVGKVGNGSAAVQTNRVFLGEAVAAGGVITSVVNYALNGKYTGAWTATLPTSSQQINGSHNMGTPEILGQLESECTTADASYSVGMRIDLLVAGLSGTSVYPIAIVKNRNSMSMSTANGSATPFLIVPAGGGAGTALTNASWKYRFVAKRKF